MHDEGIAAAWGLMVVADLREVAFLGRITAAFTHEMKNVLAIIKESAGLMEDLLALTPGPAFPHRDRFARSLTTIQAQTKRGVELSNRLNRLAHSSDKEVARVDLNDILEQVIILSERFARLKGVSLQLYPHGEALSVVVSPVSAADGGVCVPRVLLGMHGCGRQHRVIGYAGRPRGDHEVQLPER